MITTYSDGQGFTERVRSDVASIPRYGLVENEGYYQMVSGDDLITLLDKRGRKTYSSESADDWDAIAARTSSKGFEVLLDGEGSRLGEYAIWEAKGNGRVTTKKTSWISADQLAATTDWEQTINVDLNGDEILGAPPVEDIDANGIVDGSEPMGYQLLNGDQVISLYTGRGKKVTSISDETAADWDVIAAQPAEQGFTLLLEGAGSRLGDYAEWSVAADGRVTSNPRKTQWSSLAELSVSTDWETALDEDLNGDGLIGPPAIEDKDGNGLVDGTELTAYQLFNNEDPITLYSGSRRRQTTYNDDASPDWDIIAGVVGGKKGFQLLLEGEGQFVGEYAIWDVKTSGQIATNLRRTKWLDEDEIVSNGYETVFSYDINGDGVIG